MVRRATRAGLALLLASVAVTSRAAGQTLEVVADTGRITVGDSVRLRLVLRQYEGDALLEQVPHPLAALGDGVVLLGVDSMRRVADRRLETRATMAFYRPGKQTIPPFAIDFRRGAVILHGTLQSDPVPIEIAAVLTEGGGSTLRDIKEPAIRPGPDWGWLVAGSVVVMALWLWRRRRRPRAPSLAAVPAVVLEPVAPDAYAVALQRLAEIEGAGWAGQGEVVRHYEAVIDALRDYLAAAEAIPARERTTSELRRSLPPHLVGNGSPEGFARVFEASDLVKFARRRPAVPDAADFLHAARGLLGEWRSAADALR